MGKLIGVVALVVLGFFAATMLAGDLGGEVVVLTTSGEGGKPHHTSLWVVDDHKQIWLRAGMPDSAWFERLKATPHVTLEREGVIKNYRAVPIPKQRERINALMAERYGWADRLIGIMRNAEETVPIRLDPIR